MDALTLLYEFAYPEVTGRTFLDTTKFNNTLTGRGMVSLAQFRHPICNAHLAITPFSPIMIWRLIPTDTKIVSLINSS